MSLSSALIKAITGKKFSREQPKERFAGQIRGVALCVAIVDAMVR